MSKFSKRFLNEVLGFNNKETELVMKAQRIFPEMLENGATKIKSVRKLYGQIGLNKAHWLRWYNKNIINNEFFVENVDWKGFTLMVNGNRTMDFEVSIEFAKHLTMQARTQNAHEARNYFILMEKAIKGMQNHLVVREPEKAGYNEMKEYIASWYTRNYPGAKINPYVFAKEADMLNVALIGQSAKSIKESLEFNDINTREHLKVEINKALYELQILNSSLLIANMDFQQRKNIIESTCKAKYDILKLKINEELKNTNQLENINN